MKKFILLICLGLLSVNLFSQIDVKNELPLIYANIKQKAADKWPGDYEMQKFLIDKQCKAFNEYIKLKDDYSVPKEVYAEVWTRSLDKWCTNDWVKCMDDNKDQGLDKTYSCFGADWEMIVFTMKKQFEAYESLK
jgi:hypothetical protein